MVQNGDLIFIHSIYIPDTVKWKDRKAKEAFPGHLSPTFKEQV